jgi:hypothetical protein
MKLAPDTTETEFVQNESIKTVSLGTSTPDPAEQAPLTRSSTANNPEPKETPVHSRTRTFPYRGIHTYEDVMIDDADMSVVSFPMRSKSFERYVSGNTRVTIIVVLVLLIIVFVVAVLAGIDISRSIDRGKENQMN